MDVKVFYELVSNAEQFKARLKELETAKKEAEDVIALVGPAKEILTLRAVAKADIEKVAKEVEDRRNAVAVEIAAAKKEVQDRWDELSVAQGEKAKQEKLLVKATEELAEIRSKVLKDQQDAENQLKSVAQKQQELAAKEAELNDKLAKLKAITG